MPTARRDWTGSYAIALICEFTPHRANCEKIALSVFQRSLKRTPGAPRNIRRRCRTSPGIGPRTGLSEYQLACLLVNEPSPRQVSGGRYLKREEVKGGKVVELSGGMFKADDMAESLNGSAPLPPYRPSPRQAHATKSDALGHFLTESPGAEY